MTSLKLKRWVLPLLIFTLIFTFLSFVPLSSSQSTNRALLDINLSSDNYSSDNKTFLDSSGYSNHAVLNNSASFASGRYGKIDAVLNFNGSNDILKINNVVVENPTALTISAWFKKESGGATYECVLHNGTGYTIGSSAYWLGVDNADYLVATIGANNGPGWAAGKTNIKAEYGKWYHLLATWDGSTVRVYVNGEEEKQYNLNSYKNITSPTRIGASADSGSNYLFKGKVENVKILNYALSGDEIENLYKSDKSKLELSPKSRGLVAHWRMDQKDYNAQSGRLTDVSALARHALRETSHSFNFTEDRFAKPGGAMLFDGSSDYLNVANPLNQANLAQEWTVTAWVDIDSHANQYLIKGMNNGVSLSYSSTNKMLLYLNSGANDYYVYGDNTSSIAGSGWRHVAFVFRNSDGMRKIYIDGEDHTGSGPNKTSLPGGIASTLQIGHGVKGKIDDVRIYDVALSEDEIKSLYDCYNSQTTTGSLQKDLVLDMPLKKMYTKNETSGAEIMTDRTPNSNDAQNTGATIGVEGASFNGASNHYIQSISDINLNDSQTYSAWVKVSSIDSGLKGVLTTHNYTVPANLGINLINNYFAISIGYTDGTREYSNKTSVHRVALDTWTHVVLEYDKIENSVSFYINGEFDNKWILSKQVNLVADKVLVGMWSNNYLHAYRYNGEISNILIYKRTLLPEEIKTLYDRGRSDAGIIFTPED